MSDNSPKKYVKPVLKLVELAGRKVSNEELSKMIDLEAATPAPMSTSNVTMGTVF